MPAASTETATAQSMVRTGIRKSMLLTTAFVQENGRACQAPARRAGFAFNPEVGCLETFDRLALGGGGVSVAPWPPVGYSNGVSAPATQILNLAS